MNTQLQACILALMATLVLGEGETKDCINLDVHKTKVEEASFKCLASTDASTTNDQSDQNPINCFLEALGWTDSDGKLIDQTTFTANLKQFFVDEVQPKVDGIVNGCWTKDIQFSEIERCITEELKSVCNVEMISI